MMRRSMRLKGTIFQNQKSYIQVTLLIILIELMLEVLESLEKNMMVC